MTLKDYRNLSDLIEICKLVGITEEDLMYCIEEINKTSNQIIPIINKGDNPKILTGQKKYKIHKFEIPRKHFKICITSDKHVGHIYDRKSYVEAVYEEAEKRNVDLVFDLGDLLNGPSEKAKSLSQVRIGTLDESLKETNEFHQSSIPTYFITGNHDLGFMEYNLCDIGRLIEAECDNLYFLNDLFAPIEVNGLRLNLSHGYTENRLLRFINLEKEHHYLTMNNPHIICQGHFHTYHLCERGNKILYQVPSLRYGKKTSKKSRTDDTKKLGAIFLTVDAVKNKYEIRTDLIDFYEPKKLIKVAEHSKRR